MSKKDKTLKKCDELLTRLNELKKALNSVNTVSSINVQSNRKPVPALGTGWSQDASTGALHHGLHGVISTTAHPEGGFEIRHGGGVVGRVKNMAEAGARIKDHVAGLGPKDTNMHNRPSPNMPTPTKMGAKTSNIAKDDSDVSKSNYGPKGAGQYDSTTNIGRKSNNMGESVGTGPNTNVKSYSSKPGQLSAKQQAGIEAKKAKSLSSPIKQFSPQEIAAANAARNFKKSAEWIQHNEIPSADEEVTKLDKSNPAEKAENLMANQLANMMQGRAMLGTPPPRQPTDEEMFGHLAVSEEVAKSAEQQWAGAMNNWMAEASKPISQKFASEEEEVEYWRSIKVSDRDDGKAGY